jgi:hypothetical protein
MIWSQVKGCGRDLNNHVIVQEEVFRAQPTNKNKHMHLENIGGPNTVSRRKTERGEL